MAEKNRVQLRAYFNTGDTPTESEFTDLIDSYASFQSDNCHFGRDNAITAHAGGGQADAYQIGNKVNVVTTCANNMDSIKLPPGNVVRNFVVYNNTSNTLSIYPPVGGFMNEWVVNQGSNIAPYNKRFYVNYENNKWMEMT